jgi:hypothetical protein
MLQHGAHSVNLAKDRIIYFQGFVITLTKQLASRSVFGNIKHEQTVEKNPRVQFSMQTAVSIRQFRDIHAM